MIIASGGIFPKGYRIVASLFLSHTVKLTFMRMSISRYINPHEVYSRGVTECFDEQIQTLWPSE